MANQKYDAFLTVARLGSFKAAAEELGYTQAGISYLVNALEKELGLTLFLREYGGVHLTTEGREVLGLVQAINADEHALAARVRELADREGGLVRVGAFTSVAIEWFPSIARAFLDQYPKIDLKLLCIDDEEELVNAVWEGRADCAFSIAPERRNLAVCRAGEYEALPEKLAHADTAPDFGARPFDEGVARTGATTVGARDFLIAVNFNLNSTSTRRANAIAFDVREKGRPVREGNPITGKIVKDAEGNPVMRPGTLKATKAIGWYIEEYGIAQVSMNITDISVTPLHVAFDEVCRKADARGVRVTGTEIVGLVPKRALLEAGRYFLRKQHRSTGIAEEEIIRLAVKSMGLDDLKPFDPKEKVIEYLLEAEDQKKRLIDLTCKGFAAETASESPAPGGGSISAYMGALGAALGTMVANLSSHKAGWDDRWEEFSDWADRGQALLAELLHLVDEDTEAFNRIMAVFAMPKSTDEEKAARSAALQEATLYATEVPLRTMKAAVRVFPLVHAMAETGNPNSVSDAGVGALAARSAVLGACLNVKINAAGLKDRSKAEALVAEAEAIAAEAVRLEAEMLAIVEEKIK